MKQYKITFESIDGKTTSDVFDALEVVDYLRTAAYGYELESMYDEPLSKGPKRLTIELES